MVTQSRSSKSSVNLIEQSPVIGMPRSSRCGEYATSERESTSQRSPAEMRSKGMARLVAMGMASTFVLFFFFFFAFTGDF